jgi:hypothetical protein
MQDWQTYAKTTIILVPEEINLLVENYIIVKNLKTHSHH